MPLQLRRLLRLHCGAGRWSGTLTLSLIVGVGVPLAAQTPYAPQTPYAAQTPYNVGPQDVLAINVWGQPDLSGRYPVGADGSVTFPLAGRIAAGGRTAVEIQDDLIARLRDRFVKNPQVTVSIDQFRSQQVFVVGEVQKAGSYPFTGSMTFLEALAHAGSTSPRAGAIALVVRQRDGAPAGPLGPDDAGAGEVLRVQLERLAGGDLAQNVALRAGDTVLVPRGGTAFVLGQVHSPGEYAVRENGTTVLELLALAGGLTEQGSMRRIKVVRRDGSAARELKVTVNDVVKPGDSVIVAERVF